MSSCSIRQQGKAELFTALIDDGDASTEMPFVSEIRGPLTD